MHHWALLTRYGGCMLIDSLDESTLKTTFSPKIHPTAIIAPGAKIAADVSIGPYSIIGEHVSIGKGTSIASHVTIEGWTRIGDYNQIGIGSIIGGIPQDLKFNGERSEVVLGHHNIIREYVTINRGTLGGGGVTSIGDHNVLMTSSHVAHDVTMGNHNIISNSVAIGGHVVIEDWVTVGALSGLHQFVKLGCLSMVGALSLITMDVLPYSLVAGNPAKRYGINIERLRRKGYTAEERGTIKKAYSLLFQSNLNVAEALLELQQKFANDAQVQRIISFLQQSTRGCYR